MIKYLAPLLFTLVIYGCSIKKKSQQPSSINNLINGDMNIPKADDIPYFPLNSNFFVSDITNKHGDSSIKMMYSEILFNLKEPILYNNPKQLEVARLLWIRPFDNPVIIRLNKFGGTIYATIKESEKDFYNIKDYSYKLRVDTILVFDEKKWKEIITSLDLQNFWNQSSTSLDDYKDATIWVFECRLNNNYNCINAGYINTCSFEDFGYAKELFNLGKSILPMKNSRENNTR